MTILTVLAWLFLTVGVALAAYGSRTRGQASEAMGWQVTTGTVVKSLIESHADLEGPPSYSPLVTYIYEVNGAQYTGSRVAFGPATTQDWQEAEATVTAYSSGKHISVFFDAAHPENSALEIRAAGANITLLTGIALSGVGLLLLVL